MQETIARSRSGSTQDPRRVEELRAGRMALEDVLPRVVDLVHQAQRPRDIAVGLWGVADVAAHLSHVSAAETALATTIGQSPHPDIGMGEDIVADAAGFNSMTLEGDPERDPAVLAPRIETNVRAFLDTMTGMRGDEEVGWLGGLVLPSSCLAKHLLGELLVHGYDISRVERRRFPIERAHAALGFGFFLDVLRLCRPSMRRYFLNQDKGAGLEACIDLRLRGHERCFIVIEDGGVRVESPSSRVVDCHLSADPTIAMLAGFNRITPTKVALSGRMFAWGRRPWLAFKLQGLIRNP